MVNKQKRSSRNFAFELEIFWKTLANLGRPNGNLDICDHIIYFSLSGSANVVKDGVDHLNDEVRVAINLLVVYKLLSPSHLVSFQTKPYFTV